MKSVDRPLKLDKRSILSDILYVAVFFVFFGFGAQVLLQKNLIFGCCNQTLGKLDHNTFQLKLFTYSHENAYPKKIRIGDEEFAKSQGGQSRHVDTITVPRMHPLALSEFLVRMPAGVVSEFELQLDPRFWSNARFREGNMRFDYWDMSQAQRYNMFPVREVKLVFSSVGEIIQSRGSGAKTSLERVSNLDELIFRDDTPELSKLREAISKHMRSGTKITWFFDQDYHDGTSNSRLIEQIQVAFRSGNHQKAFGNYAIVTEGR